KKMSGRPERRPLKVQSGRARLRAWSRALLRALEAATWRRALLPGLRTRTPVPRLGGLRLGTRTTGPRLDGLRLRTRTTGPRIGGRQLTCTAAEVRVHGRSRRLTAATRAGFRGRGRLLAAASDAELILGELPDRSQLAEAPLIALLLRHAHRVHLEGLTLRKVGAGHGVDGVDEGQVRFELPDGLHPGLHLGVLELLVLQLLGVRLLDLLTPDRGLAGGAQHRGIAGEEPGDLLGVLLVPGVTVGLRLLLQLGDVALLGLVRERLALLLCLLLRLRLPGRGRGLGNCQCRSGEQQRSAGTQQPLLQVRLCHVRVPPGGLREGHARPSPWRRRPAANKRDGGHAGRILNRCGAARTRTSWGCLARDRWRMHPTPRSASSDVHVEEAVDVAFGGLEPGGLLFRDQVDVALPLHIGETVVLEADPSFTERLHERFQGIPHGPRHRGRLVGSREGGAIEEQLRITGLEQQVLLIFPEQLEAQDLRIERADRGRFLDGDGGLGRVGVQYGVLLGAGCAGVTPLRMRVRAGMARGGRGSLRTVVRVALAPGPTHGWPEGARPGGRWGSGAGWRREEGGIPSLGDRRATG